MNIKIYTKMYLLIDISDKILLRIIWFFFKKIEELKSYIVEFDKNSAIKPKVYPSNCTVRGNNQWSIIVITHNKYIFFCQ